MQSGAGRTARRVSSAHAQHEYADDDKEYNLFECIATFINKEVLNRVCIARDAFYKIARSFSRHGRDGHTLDFVIDNGAQIFRESESDAVRGASREYLEDVFEQISQRHGDADNNNILLCGESAGRKRRREAVNKLAWSTGCAADIRFARVTSTLDTIRVGINCRSILNVLRHM